MGVSWGNSTQWQCWRWHMTRHGLVSSTLFHRHVRSAKQSRAFYSTCCRSSGVPLESEESLQVAGQHGSPPSSQESLERQMPLFMHQKPRSVCFFHLRLLLLPLQQSMIGHKLVCFLCCKVHIHLKNRNLCHLVLLHQTNMIFFFYTFLRRNKPLPMALTLKAERMNHEESRSKVTSTHTKWFVALKLKTREGLISKCRSSFVKIKHFHSLMEVLLIFKCYI